MILFIVIILFLMLFGFLCYKKLDLGLAVLIFCLPVYLVRFKISFLPTTLLELMILVLLFVLIFNGGYCGFGRITRTIKNLLKGWWMPILLFLLAATISIFVSADFIHALGRWRAYFVEPILLFLVMLYTIKTEKQIKMIVWALGLSAGVVSLFAIIQYIFNINIPADYDLPNIKRAVSFYGYPNAIGLYVAPVVTLFMGLILGFLNPKFLNSKSQIPNHKQITNHKSQVIELLFCWLIVLLGIGGIIVAVSKGAMIGVAVGVFFMLMLTKWRWWVLGLTILFIILILIIPATHNIIWPVITFQETSGDVRLVLWEGTWNLIKANPIFGVGLAGFQEAYPNYKLAKHTEILVYPHNILLNFWVETGVLGLVAFLWLVVLFFKIGFKDLRLKIKDLSKFKIQNSKFKIALMGAMICLLVHGLVDVPYFKNDLAALFWVLVGLMIIITQINTDLLRIKTDNTDEL